MARREATHRRDGWSCQTEEKERTDGGPIGRRVMLRIIFTATVLSLGCPSTRAEDWIQLKFDSRHSGNVPERHVLSTPDSAKLGLLGAVPLTDAVFTAPVVHQGRVFVVDGAGVVTCVDQETLKVLWRFEADGGKGNCNNLSSPAVAGRYLHFGTMGGIYYVLETESGRVVKKIACDEPIFSAPVVANGRVYFASLGARIHALEPDGTLCWTWDYVHEVLGFMGDRWSGEDWLKHKGGVRIDWAQQFCCARDLAVDEKTLVVPVGGKVLWLEDQGEQAKLVDHLQGPREDIVVTGVSIGDAGAAYVQWMRNDNHGQLQINRRVDGKMESELVPGTVTGPKRFGAGSFNSVSLRHEDVYRCRPQERYGLCKYSAAREEPEFLGGYPSHSSPILLRESAVYGGLNGQLYVVPLAQEGEESKRSWSFATAFGKAISAPVAVADGNIYFGCEDGYLYAVGPGGNAAMPTKELELWKIRSPLSSSRTDAKFDWFTSFGNWANTNSNDQGVAPPFKTKWIRRYDGSVKHFSTCGGGRLYTHTAEGQIVAVEQETGRQLWQRYFPGVHISYTSPLYHEGRLLVPQAGLDHSWLRCLDAETGLLLWETPIAGSPSWNRQLPPIVHGNLVIYMYGTGKYQPDRWLFGHQKVDNFPADHLPLVRAWDIDTGKEVWTIDFSKHGAGGDESGLCMMDGTMYYSCYFGNSPAMRRGRPGAKGVTAAIDPATGEMKWLTTDYFVHGGCTISAADGRLYLGGYDQLKDRNSFVWCLDARDGSLVWESEPIRQVIKVVTIGSKHLFVHSQNWQGFLLDKETGRIATTLAEGYRCTCFVLSEPYLIGSNMDVIDLSKIDDIRLISTGPAIDVHECLGATVSNGRLFYTAHAGCLQMSKTYGDEAKAMTK